MYKRQGLVITWDEARMFKERYHFPGAKVGIALRGPAGIVVNTGSKKTNPDVNIYGGDENYLEINGYTLKLGRNFTPAEVQSGSSVCLLGIGAVSYTHLDVYKRQGLFFHRPYRSHVRFLLCYDEPKCAWCYDTIVQPWCKYFRDVDCGRCD